MMTNTVKDVTVVLLTFALVLILSFAAQAQMDKIQSHTIFFSDDPIAIQTTTVWVGKGKDTNVYCELKVIAKDKPVQAAEFTFIFYDLFDEYLDSFGGVTIGEMSVGEQIYLHWEPSFSEDWMSYTVVVFLNNVRFSDGNVWGQDKGQVAEEISRATRVLFKKEQLEKEERHILRTS